ncbi:MAG: Asp23/Gls24 family envelope stress response protein [Actinomycetota bacterium]|nr:Asp23/Gls24 family envelope stress response protein [Actinomycetota bacterium]
MTASTTSTSTSGSTPGQLPKTPEEQKQADKAAEANKPEPKQLDALHTELGDTTIADQVVEKIAGLATREVDGVYAMGSAAGRALSGLAQRLPGQAAKNTVSSGVSIEKGERQTAVEVSVVVEYGVSIVEVADNIRESVITAVEHATGLEVVEVNVTVTDVHLPDEDKGDDQGDKGSDRLA